MVLTAAHCIAAKILTSPRMEIAFSTDATSTNAPAIEVKKIIVHPDYVPTTNPCIGDYCPLKRNEIAGRMGSNDLAIILLSSDAPANYKIATLNTDENLPDTLQIITAGFGQQSDVTYKSGTLKKFSGLGEYIKDARKILSISNKNQSACYGDSGGPIYYMKDQKLIQLGVASHRTGVVSGNPCIDTESVSYTSVASFKDWIEKSKIEIQSQEDYIISPFTPKSEGTEFKTLYGEKEIWAWKQIKSAELTCVNHEENFSVNAQLSFNSFYQADGSALRGDATIKIKNETNDVELVFSKTRTSGSRISFEITFATELIEAAWKKTLNDHETLKATFDGSSVALNTGAEGISLAISPDYLAEDGSGVFTVLDATGPNVLVKAHGLKIFFNNDHTDTTKFMTGDCEMKVSLK
jgi:hypothetical protein